MKNEECAVKNKLIKSIPVGKMENLLSFVCFPRNLCFNVNFEILQTFQVDLRCQCYDFKFCMQSSSKKHWQNPGICKILSFGKYCKYHNWY